MTTTPTFHLADFIDAAGSENVKKLLELLSQVPKQLSEGLRPISAEEWKAEYEEATALVHELKEERDQLSSRAHHAEEENASLWTKVQQLEEQLRVREADVLELRGLIRTAALEVEQSVRSLGAELTQLSSKVRSYSEPLGAMVDRVDWVSVTPARPEGHIPETRPEFVGSLPGSDLPEHDLHTAYLVVPGQPMRRHTSTTEAEAARGVGVTLPANSTNSVKPAYPLVQHALTRETWKANEDKPPVKRLPAPAGGTSKGVDGKVLSVLAGHAGPCPKRRLALLAGYSATGGAFNNILSRLRTAGWVEGSAELTITRAGRAVAGRVERPPTGRALFEWWTKHPRVDGLMNAQLWALQRAGKPVTKQELAAHCEKVTGKPHSATGGSFNNALSRLSTLGLVIGKGGQKLQLVEELRG